MTHPRPAPPGPISTSVPLAAPSARRLAARRWLLVLAGTVLAALSVLLGFLMGYVLDVPVAR
ncbi:hypothetical protein [Puerhibacterium puerhi]|uniref:hypothetical protein n=1 Tax=Puerhibacterium puerhi TaxID=2692623 RepID=UPI001357A8C4|nr:hypothetical protein [Puerhibacterium puerhi]